MKKLGCTFIWQHLQGWIVLTKAWARERERELGKTDKIQSGLPSFTSLKIPFQTLSHIELPKNPAVRSRNFASLRIGCDALSVRQQVPPEDQSMLQKQRSRVPNEKRPTKSVIQFECLQLSNIMSMPFLFIFVSWWKHCVHLVLIVSFVLLQL